MMKIDFRAAFNSGKLLLKKHAPSILIFTGVTGMVAGGVMACKATRKLDDVLDDHKERVAAIPRDGDEKVVKRELTRAYFKTGGKLCKLYGTAVGVEVISITCILSGHSIMHKRNAALAAAYTALDSGFKRYRSKVKEALGDVADAEFKHDLHPETVEETVTDEETGKKKKQKKVLEVTGSGGLSDYARYFAPGEALGAEQNSDYNRQFLNVQQEVANNMLRAKGYLFLNDVYELLGIERSIAGQCVGWIYDKHANEHGDNFVDFGIREVFRPCAAGNYERVYLLDFNVDGDILNHSVDKGLLTK